MLLAASALISSRTCPLVRMTRLPRSLGDTYESSSLRVRPSRLLQTCASHVARESIKVVRLWTRVHTLRPWSTAPRAHTCLENGSAMGVHCAGHKTLSQRDVILDMLPAAMPDKFGSLLETTTRKPTKEESEGTQFFFNAKAPELQQMQAEGNILSWRQDGADIYCRTLASAEAQFAATDRITVLPLSNEEALAMVQEGVPTHALIVHVRLCSFLHAAGTGWAGAVPVGPAEHSALSRAPCMESRPDS